MNRPQRGELAPVHTRRGLWVVGIAALYFLMAFGSLALVGQRSHVALLWFANPVGAVALLSVPRRQWLAVLSALALSNLVSNLAMAAQTQALGLDALRAALAFVPGNCFEIVLSAWLLKRLKLGPQLFHSSTQLTRTLWLGAVVPTLFSAFAGAAVLSWGEGATFAGIWVTWFAGSLIGTAAVLPLALSVWLRGWRSLASVVSDPGTAGMMVLSLAVTLLAAGTFSAPFVVMVLPMMLLAVRSSFAVTALATLMNAATIGILIHLGILIPPPSATWWGDGLFYASVLATLVPGLFLAAAVEAQADVLQRLSANEERFRKLYTQTPAMLHSMDVRGRILSVSQVWLDTLGYQEAEVVGRRLADFLTLDSARYATEVVLPQSKRDGRCDNVAYQMVAKDGTVLDVLMSSVWERDARGELLRTSAALLDVTEKNRLAARSHFAEHDALTGLPNRVLLQDRLERACAHHARQGGTFAVGFLDLDHFKAVNDQYGHEAGDLLLCEVARRLKAALRESDTVCRLGGDEFVLLFTETGVAADLHKMASELFAKVAQPCQLGEGPHAPTVDVAASLGVAVFPAHGRDPQTLMQHADQAMYTAKRGGRNRYEFFRP